MAGSMLRPWEVVTFCTFTSIVCWIANFVNVRVPAPYMDELFHVGQAQRYCDGDYSSWDPKITTPPGLYFASLPFSLVTRCSVDVLRATNIIFTLANVYTMHQIRQHLQRDSVVTSLVIALHPVNFFFAFLYYTDPGCIFCLLLMYLFFLKGQHYLAAASGLVGMLFRQTSVVWTFFVACLTLSKHVERTLLKRHAPLPERVRDFLTGAVGDCFGYGVVGLLFVAFVAVNDGITLGDRDAHNAVVHLPQIGYFLLFALLFGAPYVFSLGNFIRFIDFASRYPLQILVTSLVAYGLFENFMHVHPYLLADNRHYTFYVWRRFLSKESVRQALVIVYIYVAFSLYNCVRHMGRAWIAMFGLCTAITIVPQRLLEFRYFVWPFLLLRLHFRQKQHQLLAEAFAYTALNCITFYIFIYGTFVWQHDPKHIQRFMW